MSETNNLIHLDMAVNSTITKGQDYLTLPYFPSSASNIQVYTTDGLKLNVSSVSGNVVYLSQVVEANTDVVVGIPYNMKYKFSTQVFKASTGKSASPTNASAMQVRNGTMFFSDTHTFDVKVTPEHRSTATSTFSADDRPEADQLGAIKFSEGNFRFPVYSKAKHADIVIENDSPFDSKFSSAEFESFVHPRSQRYG